MNKVDPVERQDNVGGQSLTGRTLNGFIWAITGAGSQAVVKLLVLAILARLLGPAEFGVVSAALTVVALAELFGQIGVAPAIIQAKVLDDAKVRTGATITVASGLLAGLVLYLLAPAVAAAFQIPAVEPVIRAFSLVFVISGFGVVPEALLQRRMQFRTISFITVGSYLVGYALVSIALALLGWGIWALVWAQVAQSLLASLAYVAIEGRSLRPMFDRSAFVQLFHFGAGVTMSRLGNYVALNADYFVVGRWLGADALGFYSRAYTLLVQPAQLVGTVGEKVLYPALSSVQDQKERLLRGYYRAIGLVAMTNLPLAAVLFVLAPQVIHLLLGPQWDSAVLPFQILVATLFFRTAYKLTGTVLRARGSVYRLATWQWLYAALVVAGALAGMSWGIVGVAVGVSVAIVGAYWIGVWFTGLAAGTSALVMLRIIARYTVIALTLFAALLAARVALAGAGVSDLLILAACSMLAALIFMFFFFLVRPLFGEEGDWLRALLIKKLPPRLRPSPQGAH